MMNKRNGFLLFIFVAASTLAACGGGGGGGGGGAITPPTVSTPATTQGTVASAPTASPITAFTQSVASRDTGTYNEVFPGQANVWSLDQDFSLVDGFDDQFNYAISLSVGSGGNAVSFPDDQVYSELTFTGPFMGSLDGVKVAAVSDGKTVLSSLPSGVGSVMAGTYSAFLNATSDSRLQQTLDLTALPAGSTINLVWQDAVAVDVGFIPGYDPSYRVVIRKEDETELKALYTNPTSGLAKYHSGILLDQYAGQKIVLSFEERSMTSPGNQAYAVIDNVSVTNGSKEYVTNGSFETGDLTGWTTNTPGEAQNVTSGMRSLGGLEIRRAFYTVPNKLWGRWVDTFENHTAAAISTLVTYETVLDLNSDATATGCEIIYNSTSASPLPVALTAWDIQGNRDVGLVFGNSSSVAYVSNTMTNGTCNGSNVIDVTQNISVPAGGMVAIVNFVIMDGTDTGADPNNVTVDPGTGIITSVKTAAKATDIDAEATKIITNFWTDPQYQAGMTPEQITAIKNFSH